MLRLRFPLRFCFGCMDIIIVLYLGSLRNLIADTLQKINLYQVFLATMPLHRPTFDLSRQANETVL